jgi:hypothetical protein
MEETKKPEIQIEIDETTAQGVYSNLAMIGHSENEFILDFIFLILKYFSDFLLKEIRELCQLFLGIYIFTVTELSEFITTLLIRHW